MNHSPQHIAENIKREISAIIRKLKDPRLQDSSVSIAKIEVSEKNSSCKVFISSLKGYDSAASAAKCLQSASGFIRKKLGETIKLRYVPIINFFPTSSIEYGADILKKLNDLTYKA